MDLRPLLSLLHPLSGDSFSACHAYQFLLAVSSYTESFATHDLGEVVDITEGESWMLVRPKTLFGEGQRQKKIRQNLFQTKTVNLRQFPLANKPVIR